MSRGDKKKQEEHPPGAAGPFGGFGFGRPGPGRIGGPGMGPGGPFTRGPNPSNPPSVQPVAQANGFLGKVRAALGMGAKSLANAETPQWAGNEAPWAGDRLQGGQGRSNPDER